MEQFNWTRKNKPIGMPLKDYLVKLILEERELGHKLRVAVGTDSQRSGRRYKAATVILIYMSKDLGGGVIKGLGGKMITAQYYLDTYKRGQEGVKERMLIEVGKSIEVAFDIAPLLERYGIKMEVHADINPNPKWESNKAMSEAIGYILGMGYEFKIKPEAFAASFGSDHYCH